MRTPSSAKVPHSHEMPGVAQRRIECGEAMGGIGYASRQQPGSIEGLSAAPASLELRQDIWPTDKAPIMRRLEAGTKEFTGLRWAFSRSGRSCPAVDRRSGVHRSTFLA
jgi:hypothetical protein